MRRSARPACGAHLGKGGPHSQALNHLCPPCTRLQNVTWVCRAEVAAFPAYMHKRLSPMLQLLREGAQQQARRHQDQPATDAEAQQQDQQQQKCQ